jgi:sugar/nucleoside kinase (ribokinase family)
MAKARHTEPPGAFSTESRVFDLFGFGIAAVDDLVEVAHFPQPGSKVEVLSRQRQGGGLCATALVTAARLGLRCLYGGFLGSNELSDFVRETFRGEGIEVLHEVDYPHAEPFHSIILVDRSTGERTILYSRDHVVEPRPPTIRADFIASSRALFVDHLGPEGTVHACKIAHKFGIPVIADIENAYETGVRDVMLLTDHLIIPVRLGREFTGFDSPEAIVLSLAQERACTAVTDGPRGCWFVEGGRDGQVHYQAAFDVRAVDTTGCGDVFHGAYAAGLLLGMPVSEAIRFAAAAAAIKATRPGGQLGIPDRPTVEQFLRNQ